MNKTLIPTLFFILIIFVCTLTPSTQARSVNPIYTPRSTFEQQWFDLENQYPQYVRHRQIGTSELGHPLYVFEIGNPNSQASIMIDGCLHGPEDAGIEAAYWWISNWLLPSNDARAENIRSNGLILIVPIVNYDRPDSRVNWDRVDLNRNFPYGWGTTGSSDPNDPNEQYRGPSAGSASETQAMLNAWDIYHPKIYFNTHIGGQYIQYIVDGSSSTSNLAQDFAQRYSAEIANIGATKLYTPIRVDPSGGFASSTAAMNYGAVGILFEVDQWNDIPDTLSDFRSSNLYNNIKSAYISAIEASIAISDSTSSPSPSTPQPTQTPTPSSFPSSSPFIPSPSPKPIIDIPIPEFSDIFTRDIIYPLIMIVILIIAIAYHKMGRGK